MYPLIRASGAQSPGSGGSKSAGTVSDTTAHATPWTIALPSTTKAGDVLCMFLAADSGTTSAVPVPSLAGTTFDFETFAGLRDSTSTIHGASYTGEIATDGAKTVTITVSENPTNKRDNCVIWVLFDGSSVRRPFSANFAWVGQTTNTSSSTSQPTRAVSADSGRSAGDATAYAFMINNNGASASGQWSGTRSFTAPSGWTKLQEIGSREFVDTALFSINFSHQNSLASANATYSVAATCTGLTLVVLGAVDNLNVEWVSQTAAGGASASSGVWCSKPAGAAVDDEASCFRFNGQSTAKQRVLIQRFKNVHPTRPLIAQGSSLTQMVFGANTATAASSAVTPSMEWSPRSLMATAVTVRDGTTFSTPSGMTWVTPYVPQGASVGEMITLTQLFSGTALTSGTRSVPMGASVVWNTGAVQLRAADTPAEAVEVLIAWHSMDASQAVGTMNTPSWGGWTLIGQMGRVSSSGAANFMVYMKIVKATLSDRLYLAATDVGSTATDGLTAGYNTTQREISSGNFVSSPSPLIFEAAWFGRPGYQIRADMPPPSYQRVEHNPDHRWFLPGDDYYFGFAFALPAGFPTWVNDFNVIEQIHAAPGTGSPVVSFEVRDYSLRLRGGDGKPGASPSTQYGYNLELLRNIRVNRWYSVVYHITFATTQADSDVDVWVDDVQRLADFKPPCATVYDTSVASDGGPSYRKQGLYKRPGIEAGHVVHAATALGRSYAAVDPKRTQNPLPSPEMFAAA